MATIEHRCSVCEAGFRPGALNKDGKCASCEEAYPSVKNRMEALALNKPEIHMNAKMTEEKVRQIVREEIYSIKAERKAAALEKARQVRANNIAKSGSAKENK